MSMIIAQEGYVSVNKWQSLSSVYIGVSVSLSWDLIIWSEKNYHERKRMTCFS